MDLPSAPREPHEPMPRAAAPADFRGLRVVVVAPAAPPVGGMAVQASRLAARLTDEGATVLRVATNPHVPSVLQTVGPVGDAWRRQRFRGDLCRAIQKGAEVLHVHGASWTYFRDVVAVALAEGRDAGLRTVLRWDGGDADRFFADCADEVRAALVHADEIVVPSGFLADVFRARFGIACRVVPNLVSDPTTDPPSLAGDGPLRLLCLRHLTRAYGVDVVVRAAAAAAAQGADLRLTVVGDGPERRALEEAAARSLGDRVRFLGAVPHERVETLLREHEVVVNGSWVDNFPVSLAEALASGIPVATTDAGGIRWVVQHGRTGLVTPVGDADALAASIVSLARDRVLLEDLGWRARVEALRWTWQAVRESWARAYDGAHAAAA